LEVDPLELFQRKDMVPEEKKMEMLRKKTKIMAILDIQIEKILND